MVHLIDDEVGWRLHPGALVLCPPFGVGLLHVDHLSIRTIHAYSLGKHTVRVPAVHYEVIVIVVEVLSHRSGPDAVLAQPHPHLLGFCHGLGVVCGIIFHIYLCRSRCKQLEGCSLGSISHLVEREILCLYRCRNHKCK